MSRDPDDFGSPVGGSRWFSGEPVVKKTPGRPLRVTWQCPLCSGEMRYNGLIWPTGDPGYHHTCTVCGFSAVIKGKQYPYMEYESLTES